MESINPVVFIIFLIFTGAAVLATLALYARQSLLVAYIILGAALGPWGVGFIADSILIQGVGDIGIIFLLFLLGLHLHPQNLVRMLTKVSGITLMSSLIFAGVSFVICWSLGLNPIDSLMIGVAMMFSSTIIGLKLLPTTVLHHQHIGELMISVLLLQDIIAIVTLLCVQAAADAALPLWSLVKVIAGFPLLLLLAYAFQRFLLTRLLKRFDQFHEYVFLLSIGWCLSMAETASYMGLSADIGAFIAGVAIATNTISFYIAESLKPLRDFFLVIFFFSIGAGFDFSSIKDIAIISGLLAFAMLVIKPIVFRYSLTFIGESPSVAWEVGIRLAQASEFSILVAALAVDAQLFSDVAGSVVQATTILTFIVSSYWVVMRYPTPLSMSDQLRRD